MISPLPDRERRHLLQFHLMPKLGYVRRILVAAGLIAAGILIQIGTAEGSTILALASGLPLLIAGSLLLLVRGYDLRPREVHGGSWERTTLEKFDQVGRLDRDVRKWDETLVDITSGFGCFGLLMLFLIPTAAVVLLFANAGRSGEDFAILFAADAIALILPHWITGLRRKWRPVALPERINSLRTALAALDGRDTPPCQVQPMFRVAGRGKNRVPKDARVFLRFPDGPEDFLGLQLQVSINRVQGTRYPYLYAVLVARPSFGLFDRHSGTVRDHAGGLVVERSTDDDVEVFVIRQRTTKDSGYHTKPQKIAKIARRAWDAAASLVTAPVA